MFLLKEDGQNAFAKSLILSSEISANTFANLKDNPSFWKLSEYIFFKTLASINLLFLWAVERDIPNLVEISNVWVQWSFKSFLIISMSCLLAVTKPRGQTRIFIFIVNFFPWLPSCNVTGFPIFLIGMSSDTFLEFFFLNKHFE